VLLLVIGTWNIEQGSLLFSKISPSVCTLSQLKPDYSVAVSIVHF